MCAPLFLVLPLRGVVDCELKGLALATHHGAAITNTGDHQFNAIPQQSHGSCGSRVRPRPYTGIKENIRGEVK